MRIYAHKTVSLRNVTSPDRRSQQSNMTFKIIFFQHAVTVPVKIVNNSNKSRCLLPFPRSYTQQQQQSPLIAMFSGHPISFLSILIFIPAFTVSLFIAEAEIIDPTRVIQLSWNPRAFLYKGFLSDEECEHLKVLAKDKLEKSMVADNDSGKSVESEVRTSSGMFLSKRQDEIVGRIEARIAAWTFLPEENGESIQILHYENGEKYEPHYDYFHDKNNQALGGHRIATVLMYLSNIKKGGETIFPNSDEKLTQPKDDTWSDCAKKGFAVKPEKGDALLFFSLYLDATTDSNSLHGSCPVVEGEKWSATKWIHVRSFDLPQRIVSRDCVDENELCPKWAAVGECDKNPRYMVGTNSSIGYCRKSCRAC